jgi:hypothetical protein
MKFFKITLKVTIICLKLCHTRTWNLNSQHKLPLLWILLMFKNVSKSNFSCLVIINSTYLWRSINESSVSNHGYCNETNEGSFAKQNSVQRELKYYLHCIQLSSDYIIIWYDKIFSKWDTLRVDLYSTELPRIQPTYKSNNFTLSYLIFTPLFIPYFLHPCFLYLFLTFFICVFLFTFLSLSLFLSHLCLFPQFLRQSMNLFFTHSVNVLV